jgi:alanine dehydrogenase/PNT-like protein
MGHFAFERRHLGGDVDHAWLRAGGAGVVIDCPHLHAGWPCAGWIRGLRGSECALGPPVESPTLSTGIAEIAHIVVNCVLQDPASPRIFLTEDDLASFTPGSLLVDVSCDVRMGFSWAHPTSFTQPVIKMGNDVSYYAVDHSPSYLWNWASGRSARHCCRTSQHFWPGRRPGARAP